jgi:hypothetical protein
VRRVVESGVMVQPFDLDTPLQHVDLDDVTEVAALVVGDPQHHHATYELCGCDHLNARRLAGVIQEVSGRSVVPQQVPVTAAFMAGTPSEGRGTHPDGPGAPPVPPGAPAGDPANLRSEDDDWRHDAMVRLFAHYGRYGITGNPNVLGWLLGRRVRAPLPGRSLRGTAGTLQEVPEGSTTHRSGLWTSMSTTVLERMGVLPPARAIRGQSVSMCG